MTTAEALTAHPGDRIHLIVRDVAGNVILESDTTVRSLWVRRVDQTLTLVVREGEEYGK